MSCHWMRSLCALGSYAVLGPLTGSAGCGIITSRTGKAMVCCAEQLAGA